MQPQVDALNHNREVLRVKIIPLVKEQFLNHKEHKVKWHTTKLKRIFISPLIKLLEIYENQWNHSLCEAFKFQIYIKYINYDGFCYALDGQVAFQNVVPIQTSTMQQHLRNILYSYCLVLKKCERSVIYCVWIWDPRFD